MEYEILVIVTGSDDERLVTALTEHDRCHVLPALGWARQYLNTKIIPRLSLTLDPLVRLWICVNWS